MKITARPSLAGGGAAFIARQQRDWKVTVARTSLDRLAYQIVFPYLSIYIVALGASATQLGLVNSLGLVAAGLVSPYIGWLIDRRGPRTRFSGVASRSPDRSIDSVHGVIRTSRTAFGEITIDGATESPEAGRVR